MILSARRLRQAPQTQPRRAAARGFTLIELLIAVAIVGILARIALPAYFDSVKRGKITEGFNGLTSYSLTLAQYYQDNRTYAAACSATLPAPTTTSNFVFSCPTASATAVTVAASGVGSATGAFYFTVDQNGTRNTTGVPSGWPLPPSGQSCWIASKSGACYQ